MKLARIGSIVVAMTMTVGALGGSIATGAPRLPVNSTSSRSATDGSRYRGSLASYSGAITTSSGSGTVAAGRGTVQSVESGGDALYPQGNLTSTRVQNDATG